jgi:hypothetical protein
METLGRQPLFKLLGAIIVLLIADQYPQWALAAAAVWAAWIYASYYFARRPSVNFARPE